MRFIYDYSISGANIRVDWSVVDTIQRYYRVDRRDIFFIQSIFEGYDGLVTMSTIDPTRGEIRLSMSPDTETDVSDILQDLKASGVLIEAVGPV